MTVKMQRKVKYIFLLFALILLLTNLHFWNVINVFYLFKDLRSYEIVDIETNTSKFEQYEVENKSDEPIYADEGFTEEEIRLFGPLEEREVRLNTDMFFFVTSGQDDLICKEACLIESAARLHSYRRIFVLFITPNVVDVLKSFTMSILVSFDNIYLRHINVQKYFVHPDAKEWFINSDFQKTDQYSKYLENALTYAFLDKFGGTVLSFDYLLLQSITGLGQSVGRCNTNWIEPQPLTINSRHPVLYEFQVALKEYHSFNSTRSIGRDMMTNVIKEKCKVSHIRELKFKDCEKAVTILEPTDFCPFPQIKHGIILDPGHTKYVKNKILEHQSYAIRLWNRMNENVESWGSQEKKTPFYTLAEEKCPMVFQLCAPKGRF